MLFASHISSLVIYFFMSFNHFQNRFFFFYYWVEDTSPWSTMWFASFFPQAIACPFKFFEKVNWLSQIIWIPLKTCTAFFLLVNATASYMHGFRESKPEPFFRLATNDPNIFFFFFCFLPMLFSVPADLNSEPISAPPAFTSGLLTLLGNIFFINYPHCHFKRDLWRERRHKFTSVHKRPWKLFSFIFKLRMFVDEVILQKDTPPKIFRKVAVIYARRKETSNQFWMTLRKKILDL